MLKHLTNICCLFSTRWVKCWTSQIHDTLDSASPVTFSRITLESIMDILPWPALLLSLPTVANSSQQYNWKLLEPIMKYTDDYGIFEKNWPMWYPSGLWLLSYIKMSIEWEPDITIHLLVIYFVYFVLIICWAGLSFILSIVAILKQHCQSVHFAPHQT